MKPIVRDGSASPRKEPHVDIRLSDRAISFSIDEVDSDGQVEHARAILLRHEAEGRGHTLSGIQRHRRGVGAKFSTRCTHGAESERPPPVPGVLH
ncbi:MAG: hypothetical protein RI554_11285, partial [Trueperaceae bacterium]|nr:hypothetical protein [Trueperaceae bacterium]